MPTFDEVKGDVEVYFFGRWNVPGHYLYTPRRMCAHVPDIWGPYGGKIDGKLQPLVDERGRDTLEEVEGAASLHMRTAADGKRWTVLAFWDRSGDKRGHSNSNFLAVSPEGRGFFTFEQMVELAELHFPTLMERLKKAGITIRLVTTEFETGTGWQGPPDG